MKLEEAKVGTAVCGPYGNRGIILEVRKEMCCVDFGLSLQRFNPPWYHAAELKAIPTQEDIVEFTMDAFAKSTVKEVSP